MPTLKYHYDGFTLFHCIVVHTLKKVRLVSSSMVKSAIGHLRPSQVANPKLPHGPPVALPMLHLSFPQEKSEHITSIFTLF